MSLETQNDQVNENVPLNPFLPKNLFQLFFNPKKFFLKEQYYSKAVIIFAAYLYGMFSVMDRIDQKLLRAELNGDFSTENTFYRIASSWEMYWAFVLGIGIISAVIIWLIYGWWYKKRLQFSGVKDVDTDKARQVYIVHALVFLVPAILVTLIQTFLFPDYLTAYHHSDLLSLIVLGCLLWSCWTCYRSATVVFHANKWAVFWFLIFPISIYLFAMGALAYVFMQLAA